MPFLEELKKQFSELVDFFAQQTKASKFLAGIILALLFLEMGYMVFNLALPVEYEQLYSGLSAEAAVAVKEELETLGIVPEIDDPDHRNLWTIRVPQGMARELRLETVSVIETSGGKVGWSIFDAKDFGMTTFAQEIKRQRAIKGELERTIQQIDMVRSASVAISTREQSDFFEEDKEPPTASVLLTLAPNTPIGKDAVRTIQKLVSGSIEGLTPENVTVADTLGNELSLFKKPDTMEEQVDRTQRLIEIHRQQREEYEDYLEKKIVNSFSQIFGKNHVTANVNVEFDYTNKEENEVKYEKNPITISQAFKVAGEGVSPRLAFGITGAAAQLPPAGVTPGDVEGEEKKEYIAEDIRNNVIGKTETKTIYPEYQIKRITVSMFVDNYPTMVDVKDDKGNVVGTVETRNIVDALGNITSDPNSLSEEDIENFEDQVKGIINYSEERPGGLSDSVYVVNKPFSVEIPVAPEVIVKEKEKITFWRNMRIFGWILLFIVVVVFVGWPLTRIIAPKKIPMLDLAEARVSLPEEERVLLRGEELVGALPEAEEEEVLPLPKETPDQIQVKQEELDDLILELARGNPKKVPLVFRSWIEG